MDLSDINAALRGTGQSDLADHTCIWLIAAISRVWRVVEPGVPICGTCREPYFARPPVKDRALHHRLSDVLFKLRDIVELERDEVFAVLRYHNAVIRLIPRLRLRYAAVSVENGKPRGAGARIERRAARPVHAPWTIYRGGTGSRRVSPADYLLQVIM